MVPESFGWLNTGSIGIPETVIAVGGTPRASRWVVRLIDRDEVMSGTRTEPLHVDVKVSYDNGLSSGQPFFANQPGDDLGRHEMGADRHVGLVFLKKLDQRGEC